MHPRRDHLEEPDVSWLWLEHGYLFDPSVCSPLPLIVLFVRPKAHYHPSTGIRSRLPQALGMCCIKVDLALVYH